MSCRILIVGAGAIGGVMAARLSQHGADVTVLDADENHVRRLRNGLQLEWRGGSATVPLEAYSSASELPRQMDVALFTVKAQFLQSAVREVLDSGRVKVLVPLGNGLVHDDVERIAATRLIVRGIVEWGATNHGNGRVEQTTDGAFSIGVPDAPAAEIVENLIGELERVWPVVRATDIDAHIWSKLLLNSTFSGLGTVAGATYEAILRSTIGRDLAVATWRESLQIATYEGRVLPPVAGVDPRRLGPEASPLEVDSALDDLLRTVGPTRASMLQDLEQGRTTEVTWINGGIRRQGEAYGLDVRHNRGIEAEITGFELGRARPGFDRLALLAEEL